LTASFLFFLLLCVIRSLKNSGNTAVFLWDFRLTKAKKRLNWQPFSENWRKFTMSSLDKTTKLAILRALNDSDQAASSSEIADQIQAFGLDLSPRTVRLHMKTLESQGLVEPARLGRSGGRRITELGINEIADAGALERLGFIVSMLDQMAWSMTYDPIHNTDGTIVLNVSLIEAAQVSHALREMAVIFHAKLGLGEYVGLFPPGTDVHGLVVPQRMFGIGTVCSVTVNGVLIHRGVPVVSRFGGVLQTKNGSPARFVDLITYEGTTLDPLEVFIKAGLTRVHEAAILGDGLIGASFREFPTGASSVVESVRHELDEKGLGGILDIGKPNRPLLDIPVQQGRTAFVVAGGLNPAAAVEESGIATTNSALTMLYPMPSLVHYSEMQRIAMRMLKES
jgi:repressor of nif and glnA expression